MPALLEYVRDEALPDRDEVLARLASHDRDVVLRMLTLLCPCRNQCYDADIWSKLPPIRDSQWDFDVREAASHAIGTLRERARVDRRSRQLIDALTALLGEAMYSPSFRRGSRERRSARSVRAPKIALRDVPTLIELLASDDEESVRDAIAALCPADGRHPSRKVWCAILEAQHSADENARRKAILASAALAAHQRSCTMRHGS